MTFKPRLFGLLLALAAISVGVGFVNALHAGYLVQRAQVIQNSLGSGRLYAEKLAQAIDLYLDALHQQLAVMALQLEDGAQRQVLLERLRQQADTLDALAVADAGGHLRQYAARDAAPVLPPGPWEASQVLPAQAGMPARLVLAQALPSGQETLLAVMALEQGSGLDRLIAGQVRDAAYSVHLVSNTEMTLYGAALPAGLSWARLPHEPGALLREPGQGASGVAEVVGHAPVGQGRWTVVLRQPLAPRLASLALVWRESLAMATPAALFMFFLVGLLAYGIARPLTRLARAIDSGSDAAARRASSWYFEADRLRSAVLAALGKHQTEVKRLNTATMTDPLTGLLNRRALEPCLEALAATQQEFAVLALDVDHFKQINDRHGHPAGDAALRALAEIARGCIRPQDRFFRVGGEEFLAVVPGDAQTAGRIAERIRLAVAGQAMPDGVGVVTVSLGLARWPADAASIPAVLARADQALYAAKQGGRNRVVRWDAGKLQAD
ncbi:diguanylate cyclase [Bordetella hinzii]|uniref:GGDEF domain-containing protein n=1 Tax=Bordetella hinzii TaxID=103855 RepID=UPI0039FBB68B